jgi:hypothetical protein
MYNSSLLLNSQTSPIHFALESYLLLCTRECYVAQYNPACAGVRDTWLYLHEIMNAYFRSHIEDGLTGDLGERMHVGSSVKLNHTVISATVCSDPRSTIFEDETIHLCCID